MTRSYTLAEAVKRLLLVQIVLIGVMFLRGGRQIRRQQRSLTILFAMGLAMTNLGIGEIDLTPKRLAHAESVIEQQNSLIASLLSALKAITNSGPDAIPIKEAFEMAHRAIERASGGRV